MAIVELTEKEIEIINNKIDKEKKELDSEIENYMEEIFGVNIRYEKYKIIDILEGILKNEKEPITIELIGSIVTLVNKFYLEHEDDVIARNYVVAKGKFDNLGSLPWERYTYDSVMLINLDTGIVDRQISYVDDEESALEILFDGYYIASISKRV